ncbi:hypothetical protein FSP39_007415 [Pinctada imbricata]|uniref:Uncharacterized protein n=1 Tax=Pinctada imbricata TaxID=66713 RepID=A0AA88YFX9_PINIB|nr:hypothetical protein FSP39_007415 [Pinctada imbricata]
MDRFRTSMDSVDYNGIYYIYIPQDDVWKPDLVLQNSNSKIKELGGDFYTIAVAYTGEVSWYPYEVFTTKCSIDMTYFPYDTQTCDIEFTVWSYKSDDVNISYNARLIFDDYEEHSIWSIESSNSDVWYRPSDCGVTFRLILKRKPEFYILNILFPIALISFITNVAFIIPSGSGEKIGFSVTIFLTFAVFLTIVSAQLPTNSENTAIVSVYIVVEILYSVLALIISSVSVRLQNRDKGNINKFYRLLIKVSKYLLFQRGCRRKPSEVQIATSENCEKKDIQKESDKKTMDDDHSWPEVCHAIDVICFWMFNLANILTIAVVFGVLQRGRNANS